MPADHLVMAKRKLPYAKQKVTITAADTAALLVDGSGLHRQPPGPQALITLDVIAYTSSDTRTLTTTVANIPVTITATPISYTFDWGDGATTTTTDPPWPPGPRAARGTGGTSPDRGTGGTGCSRRGLSRRPANR